MEQQIRMGTSLLLRLESLTSDRQQTCRRVANFKRAEYFGRRVIGCLKSRRGSNPATSRGHRMLDNEDFVALAVASGARTSKATAHHRALRGETPVPGVPCRVSFPDVNRQIGKSGVARWHLCIQSSTNRQRFGCKHHARHRNAGVAVGESFAYRSICLENEPWLTSCSDAQSSNLHAFACFMRSLLAWLA